MDEWALLIADATQRMDARDIAKLRRGVPALRNLSIAAETLIEDIQRQLNISQSEIEVLQFVSQHPGCGVSDIARLRFLRASNVSATVRRLINSGLLVRRENDFDRRA